ncbi:hypothetical protein A3A60_04495 [Candidatus Curtissbacteria bacterium RIFCSPLOWO2_01_FULL_42_26]|uniref:Mannose-6-phosphate isomerase type II C-terminal domain-containing protein n=1 Tax=Candidatus Curtissbacteria bacterium RIFCSPLOWO2_01_FULL_42_26 TaxID=1797729 RepID=A0A1F5HXJ4_9BACT|nr:MAG: hypothetical protein A3A60_04495 [Candidatus Curtissbacteria bacterium RIFCSPLOWO2_01_FULL_42_26]
MADLDSSQKFNNRPYARRIEKPWGWEIHWVPDDKPYMGKILHINAGQRLSLQYHDKKQESWLLVNGRAKVVWDDEEGNLVEIELELGKGFTCDLGQKHRLVGVTECDIIEISTPEIGITYRLEDDYQRAGKNEDEKERELRNRGKV